MTNCAARPWLWGAALFYSTTSQYVKHKFMKVFTFNENS